MSSTVPRPEPDRPLIEMLAAWQHQHLAERLQHALETKGSPPTAEQMVDLVAEFCGTKTVVPLRDEVRQEVRAEQSIAHLIAITGLIHDVLEKEFGVKFTPR